MHAFESFLTANCYHATPRLLHTSGPGLVFVRVPEIDSIIPNKFEPLKFIHNIVLFLDMDLIICKFRCLILLVSANSHLDLHCVIIIALLSMKLLLKNILFLLQSTSHHIPH